MKCSDKKWRPVAFISKSLSDTECNYEIYNKEMLAVVRCLEAWISEQLGTRLQENPQLILQLVFIIQLTSRRILRE